MLTPVKRIRVLDASSQQIRSTNYNNLHMPRSPLIHTSARVDREAVIHFILDEKMLIVKAISFSFQKFQNC